MADSGFSYDTLVASLSAFGTSSGELISLSVTGNKNKVIPLVNYGDFSQHVFFGDAIRKFNTSVTRIVAEYPIGISGTDVSSLCALILMLMLMLYQMQQIKMEIWFH